MMPHKEWNTIWEKIFKNQAWGRYPAEGLVRFIARSFYKNPDKSKINILELGSGPAANIWYLGKEGFHASGIKNSKEALQQYAQRNKTEHIGTVELINADLVIELDSLRPNSLDAIIDAECFSHIPKENLTPIFLKCQKVLKQGGLLYSRTYAKEMATNPGLVLDINGNVTSAETGALAGKGFTRFTDIDEIKAMYGNAFDIESLSREEMTNMTDRINDKIVSAPEKVTEWVVICKNLHP
jgi:hypothetical protein